MPSSFDDAILANCNPSVPIGPFDGLVAAYMCFEERHILCTSPNQTHIPLPVLGEEDVRLRANLRYGTADHTLWPQFVIPNTSHFAVMPKKPVASDDSLAPIWWDPTPADFVPSYGGIITGIGSVHKHQLNALQRVEAEMQNRVDHYLNSSPKPSENATQQISLRRYHMENSYVRLCSLKTSYVETVFTVTEFQRYCLEILGFLNFMETYRPRLAGSQLGSNQADHLMGCFTWDSTTTQELFKAGVPVWFLRQWEGPVYPYDNNILKIVDFTMPHPSILKECSIITLPTLFRGRMTDEGRYNAIWNRSMARLNPADPFRGEVQTGSQTTSQPNTSSSLSRASPRPYPAPEGRKGVSNAQTSQTSCNKFQPLAHPAAPFPIPAWSEALASVDCSPLNIIDEAELGNTRGHYVVPDPGVLVMPQSDEKRAQYFTTWLQCRDNWLRVTEDGGLAQSNQSWRDILGLGFNSSLESNSTPSRFQRLSTTASSSSSPTLALHPSLPTRPLRSTPSRPRSSKLTTPQERRNQAMALFKSKSIFESAVQAALVVPPVVWNGHELTPHALPSQSTIREILWELYEINFVYELEALDRRACDLTLIKPDALYERQRLVIRCYDNYEQYKRPSIPVRNIGLAADDIMERLPFVIALAQIMRSWKGDLPQSFSKLCDSRRPEMLGRDVALNFEKDVAKFYCQTFFNHFGRAAQVPHRLYHLQ